MPITSDDNLLGKKEQDLQYNVKVNENTGLISGVLNYVTGYTGFSSKIDEQNGNYIALDLAPKNGFPESLTVEVKGGTSGPSKLLPSNHQVVLKIKDNTKETIVVTAVNKQVVETKEYKLTSLALSQPPIRPYSKTYFGDQYTKRSVEMCVEEGLVIGKNFADIETPDKYMSVDNCQINGNDIYIDSVHCNKGGWFDNKPVILLCYNSENEEYTNGISFESIEMNGVKYTTKHRDHTYLKLVNGNDDVEDVLFLEIENEFVNEVTMSYCDLAFFKYTLNRFKEYAQKVGKDINELTSEYMTITGTDPQEMGIIEVMRYYNFMKIPENIDKDGYVTTTYKIHVNTFD